MGGSVGSMSKCSLGSQYDHDFSSLFVDKSMIEGEELLQKSDLLRQSFVEYIKGGSWMEQLTQYENIMYDDFGSTDEADGVASTWARFGYACPTECGHVRSPSLCSTTTQLSLSTSRKTDIMQVTNTTKLAQATIQECYGAVDSWNLFLDNAELRAILFAALYPLYLKSAEFRQLHHPVNCRARLESASSDSAESASFSSHFSSITKARKAKKSERLRELMVGAAALFDSSELELYLANSKISWIEDFKAAITNLQANIMVCKVTNTDHKESKVIYSNIRKQNNQATIPEHEEAPMDLPIQKSMLHDSLRMSLRGGGDGSSSRTGCDKASKRVSRSINNRSPVNSEGCGSGSTDSADSTSVGTTLMNPSKRQIDYNDFSDKVGKNLHELHSTGRSLDSAKVLEQAIFNARFYKQRFVRSNGDFQLRALKPIFTPQGKYAFMLSVEAFGTADHSTVPDLRYPPDTQFQQVDDLLALLPLFIKTTASM